MPQPDSLLTCRYWAFGPCCPNISGSGENICVFAHWDTGKLVPEKKQRGTCQGWFQGRCPKGQACWYEHRDTGVIGMNQGPLPLTGLELDIAKAAASTGFDTWNHEALYELIWAVKRIAMHNTNNGNSTKRPPRHPLYPERYRPSGVGDNTKRKRRRTQTARVFRHKNGAGLRGGESQILSIGLSSRGHTAQDPIDLSSNEGTSEEGQRKKRAKVDPNDANNKLGSKEGSLSPESQHHLRSRLIEVENRLERASQHVSKSREIMKEVFEDYQMLSSDDIMSDLRNLSEVFDTIETQADIGGKHIDFIKRLST